MTAAVAKPRQVGIIMQAVSIAAILDNRKDQTRRLIKPSPDSDNYGDAQLTDYNGVDVWFAGPGGLPMIRRRPRYRKGDHLWVRETFGTEGVCDHHDCIVYRADGATYEANPSQGICQKADFVGKPNRWRSPMIMPKWAARIWLRVTAVRIERLQLITVEEIEAEGVRYPVSVKDCPPGKCWPLLRITGPFPPRDYLDATGPWTHAALLRAEFASVWDGLHHKAGFGWATDPWLQVINFETMERPDV